MDKKEPVVNVRLSEQTWNSLEAAAAAAARSSYQKGLCFHTYPFASSSQQHQSAAEEEEEESSARIHISPPALKIEAAGAAMPVSDRLKFVNS